MKDMTNNEYFDGLDQLECPLCGEVLDQDDQDDSGVFNVTCPNPDCILGNLNSLGYGDDQRVARENVKRILEYIREGMKDA